MAFLGLIVTAFAKILSLLINFYTILLVARIILSWVNPDPGNAIVRFIHQSTEPALIRGRRLLPVSFFQFGIDFSPIIIFILLTLIETIVVGGLYDLAYMLRNR